MREILIEAAKSQQLPRSIVETAFSADLGVVSPENASAVARRFAMRGALFHEALRITECRLDTSECSEELHAIAQLLTKEVLAMPGYLEEVRDPIGILKVLHENPEPRIPPVFVSAILGMREEQIGGEVERYSPDEVRTQYSRGGFMYQPSELKDIRPIFEHLSFATGSIFYDLGSGYGHALFYGAALRPDVSFRGIEIMSARVNECRSAASRLGIKNVAFEAGDLSKGGFSDADIIFLFNPFPPDTQGEICRQIEKLADSKPLVILDYRGLVSHEIVTLRALSFRAVSPYRLSVSRQFHEESRALLGLGGPDPR